MKVLVFGAGRMGTIRVEDLAADARVDEVIVTNRTLPRAHELGEKFGATALPWDDALATDVDAVVVAVGTDAHDSILHAVLPRGIPVLCEKPIAMTLGATREAIDLAAAHGAGLQVGFQRRFDEPLRAIHDRIADGALGTVYSLNLTARDRAPSAREFIAGSGGIFRDLHVHDFDLIRWLTGSEVETVFAAKSVREHRDYADFDDADVSSVIAVTTEGIQVTVNGARHDARGHDVRLEAFGSLDSVSAGFNERTPLLPMDGDLRFADTPYTGFVDRFREAFRNETAAFVSFANGEIDNPCPPDSALESLRIAIACEESITSGKSVRVSEVR